MRRSGAWAVTLAVGALVLGGCGSQTRVADGQAATAISSASLSDQRPEGCSPAAPVGAIPPAAQVTGVLRCVTSPERVAGDGEWQVIRQERATGAPVAALMSALALPSEHPVSDQGCAAVLVMPTAVELETDSGKVLVGPPETACHNPLPQVVTAYGALPWVTVTTTKVRQIRSEAALAGGCDPWKDEVAIEERGAKPATAAPVLPADASVSVCVYRSEYPPGWVAGSQNAVDGIPVGGRPLTTDEARRLGALLASAGAAAPCTVPHTSFAVVSVGKGDPLYAELDGCLRVLTPDHTLHQGNADLAALLKVA